MILLIDNYDSFTYNLFQYFGELGAQQEVVRNDQISVEEVLKQKPQAVILSPGPCYPADAGICIDLVKRAHNEFPILGVCLGHQAICEAFGATIVKAPSLYHGKTSPITHNNSPLFHDLPNPLTVGRYHSLVADAQTMPDELEIIAKTEDGVIMAVSHKQFPIYGIQFHPESVLTPEGKKIMHNFLRLI